MTLLAEIGSRLRSLLRLGGAYCLFTPEPVQRLASQALSRLAELWPALGDLLPAEEGAASFRAGVERRAVPVDPVTAAERSGVPTSAAEAKPSDSAESRDTWIARLRDDADFGVRAEAARALASHRDPAATHALCEALRDSSVEVAIAATEALTRHGGAPVRLALRTVVKNDDGYYSALVRASALLALARISPGDDRDLLLAAMRDTEAEVSIAAITAVAEQPGSEGVDALCRLLADPSGFYLPVTRLAAAKSLARRAPLEAGRVRDLLRGEPDPAVRDVLEGIATTPSRDV